MAGGGNYQVSQQFLMLLFSFLNTLSLAFIVAFLCCSSPLSRKPFKTHNNNAKFERDKRRTWAGNGNDYISLAGQAAVAGRLARWRGDGAWTKRRRNHCCCPAIVPFQKEGERGCNFHLATVCFTCAVISDKRSGRKPKEGTEAPGNGRNQATRAQFTHLKFK